MNKKKADLLKKIHGGQVCQIVAATARLGLADLLKDEAKPLAELSSELEIPEDLLLRLVSSLTALFLIEEYDNKYRLTEEGRYLISDSDDSLHAIAAYKGSPFVWRSLEKLAEGLKTGVSPFELAHGCDQFTYLSENPGEMELFQNAMDAYEKQSSKKILDAYDFSSIKTVLDIGGGTGSFLKTLINHSPHIKGALFDLPSVKPDRDLTFIPGDFFKSVPSGYDAYILRNILHDWSDSRCLTILENLRDSLKPSSKILIFETLLDPSHKKRLGKFSDLSMFTLTPGGKERTLAEFEALLESACLQLWNVYRSTGSKSIIECRYHGKIT
jgi:hypothetical protein